MRSKSAAVLTDWQSRRSPQRNAPERGASLFFRGKPEHRAPAPTSLGSEIFMPRFLNSPKIPSRCFNPLPTSGGDGEDIEGRECTENAD